MGLAAPGLPGPSRNRRRADGERLWKGNGDNEQV
jgi:hypothetical protein